MSRDWKKWVEEKGIQKWFRRDNLIVLVLAGILLVIIALPTKEGGQKTQENAEGVSGILNEDNRSTGQQEETQEEESYAAYLEERLTQALSSMAGVGKVEVMITVKSSRELVVEKEQPVNRSSTNEKDAQGGSRSVSQVDSQENTVYQTQSGASAPFVVKTLPPRIEGVLVVAEGAGNGTIDRNIVEIAQALFGVEAHKVKVVKMEAVREESR
jgi:stage III sporulation protein AG